VVQCHLDLILSNREGVDKSKAEREAAKLFLAPRWCGRRKETQWRSKFNLESKKQKLTQ